MAKKIKDAGAKVKKLPLPIKNLGKERNIEMDIKLKKLKKKK